MRSSDRAITVRMTALLFSALLCACSAKGTIENGEAVVICRSVASFSKSSLGWEATNNLNEFVW